jgi:hypothetical protein
LVKIEIEKSKRHYAEYLDVNVPHLHELLLAFVDVGKLVNHLAHLGRQPLRINLLSGNTRTFKLGMAPKN